MSASPTPSGHLAGPSPHPAPHPGELTDRGMRPVDLQKIGGAGPEGGAKAMSSSSNIHNADILIVDDQAANVALLEQMLRGAGYVSITSTMNPYEVCELHRKHRYSLILLD